MGRGAVACTWGTSNQEPLTAPPRAKHCSSSSTTSARRASRSGRSSISTRMASSCHRSPVWSAGSATLLAWSTPSRLWITAAHPVRSGRRRGCQRDPFRSTCTMSQWSVAIAASGARSPSGTSWTSPAASAGSAAGSFATCGPRTGTSCGRIASTARTTSGPLRTCRRKRAPLRVQIWSTLVRDAAACAPYIPRSFCEAKAWPAAPRATGWATLRCTPLATSKRSGSSGKRPGALATHPTGKRKRERGGTRKSPGCSRSQTRHPYCR
mmetsp:Transcript_107318/g.269118  ORF Transcript_107318/g.269118 Transcript_107318/m.269118 type:complete len:267 (-) Transcript_107318:80-880(-)